MTGAGRTRRSQGIRRRCPRWAATVRSAGRQPPVRIRSRGLPPEHIRPIPRNTIRAEPPWAATVRSAGRRPPVRIRSRGLPPEHTRPVPRDTIRAEPPRAATVRSAGRRPPVRIRSRGLPPEHTRPIPRDTIRAEPPRESRCRSVESGGRRGHRERQSGPAVATIGAGATVGTRSLRSKAEKICRARRNALSGRRWTSV